MFFDRQIETRLLKALDQLSSGSLSLTLPSGETRQFCGAQNGPKTGPKADLRLRDWGAVALVAAKGDIGLAEAYRDGRIESQDLEALLTLALQNEAALEPFLRGTALQNLVTRALYLFDSNTRRGSRRNISAHYDLGNAFYQLWLDPSMTYSSALYGAGDDLAAAQTRKYDRIIDGLAAPSGRVLEIGCGWGGFAERALARGDYATKGLTLSTEQAAFARNRLGNQAEIALQDYRDERGLYDHIVSIEMFEAVGERFWPQWFGKLGGLLAPKGRAMVQTITIAEHQFERYRKGGDMIRSFIFPGGMLPAPSRFEAGAEAAGLRVEERFAFGRDYARTLRDWLGNFERVTPQVAGMGFDAGFIRLWRFYLAACIAAFETGRCDVYHYQLAHA